MRVDDLIDDGSGEQVNLTCHFRINILDPLKGFLYFTGPHLFHVLYNSGDEGIHVEFP